MSLVRLAVILPILAYAQGTSASPTDNCPLTPVAAGKISGPLGSASPLMSASPQMIAFTSPVARDEDGNPQAYHRGLSTAAERDPGLDQICNGMSVLEMDGSKLRNKYSNDGSGSSLSKGTDDERRARARACKSDFIALRDAGFPACGSGKLCGYFFGIAVEPRACGYPRGKLSANDTNCGIPILQKDASGQLTGFYLTTNTLIRRGATAPLAQADYADALKVPFIVMPGGQKLPTTAQWAPGDLAVVLWHGKIAYAVVGDAGPAGSVGEASRALLSTFGVMSIDESDPALTLLLPGTNSWLAAAEWPLTPATIKAATMAKLREAPGGLAGLSKCKGFEAIQ